MPTYAMCMTCTKFTMCVPVVVSVIRERTAAISDALAASKPGIVLWNVSVNIGKFGGYGGIWGE